MMGGCGTEAWDYTHVPIALTCGTVLRGPETKWQISSLRWKSYSEWIFEAGKFWLIPFSTVPFCERPILSEKLKPDDRTLENKKGSQNRR